MNDLELKHACDNNQILLQTQQLVVGRVLKLWSAEDPNNPNRGIAAVQMESGHRFVALACNFELVSEVEHELYETIEKTIANMVAGSAHLAAQYEGVTIPRFIKLFRAALTAQLRELTKGDDS